MKKPISAAIKVILAFALSLPIFALTACSSSEENMDGNSSATYRQISQEEALDLMSSESGYIILDVRTPEEFNEAHIVGAINLPLDEIGQTDPAELPDKNQLIMVYCRSGNRSKQASEKLVDLGYTNIVEFGGINTWPGEIEAPNS